MIERARTLPHNALATRGAHDVGNRQNPRWPPKLAWNGRTPILRGRSTNRAEDLAHGAQQVLKGSGFPPLKDETTKQGKQEAQLLFQKAVDVATKDHEKVA